MSLRVDQVERALVGLWQEAAARGMSAHARMVNLVVICEDPSALATVREISSQLLRVFPGRCIVVHMREGAPPQMLAEVALLCEPQRADVPCSDSVDVEVVGSAREWLPGAVETLLSPGALVHLWWVGDLPDDDTVYDRLTDIADVITLNSAEMDLRDLRTLSGLVRGAKGRYVLADQGWLRLRPWRELLAQFFDDPAVLAELANVSTVSITTSEYRRGTIREPASTQAGLLLGWFAERTRAVVTDARWTSRDGDVREVVIPRPNGGTLTARFRSIERNDVYPGALLRVEMATDGCARFVIGREDNPRVLGWQGECADAVIPQAVMRIEPMDPAQTLAKQLETPLRDRIFEAGLAAAAAIIASLYGNNGTERAA